MAGLLLVPRHCGMGLPCWSDCSGEMMDADLLKVYARLAASLKPKVSETPHHEFPFPDLCTAEMTTFLKETN